MQKVHERSMVALTFSTLIEVYYTLKLAKTKTKSPKCQQHIGKTHAIYLKVSDGEPMRGKGEFYPGLLRCSLKPCPDTPPVL